MRWFSASIPILLGIMGLFLYTRGTPVGDHLWYFWIIMAITFNTFDRRYK